MFSVCWVPCMLIMNGIEVCSIGVPSGRVMVCTRPMPGLVEDRLGDPVDDQHVRGVAQIVVGLDHQQFGVHPGRGKCRSAAANPYVGRDVRGQVMAVVVVGR